MSWHVDGSAAGCGADAPWAVIDETDGSVVACYPDEAGASAAIAELQAAERGGGGPGAGGAVSSPPPVAAPSAPAHSSTAHSSAAGELVAFAPTAPGPAASGTPASGAPTEPAMPAAPAPPPMPAMPMPGPDMAGCVPWAGVLAVEGTPTGDGREFTPGALTWADLPLPLRWQCEDTHGGMLVNGVVTVGRIDTVTRAGAEIRGTGVIDAGSPEGAEAARRMGTEAAPGFLSGVSIDADDPADGLVDYVMPDGCDNPTSMDDAVRCSEPAMTIFHSGRIRAATLCDIPAFTQARVYLTNPPPAAPAPAGPAGMAAAACCADCEHSDALSAVVAAAHAITLQVPDPAWFTEPTDHPEIGAITLTDDGRLFGYLAPRQVAHRGYPDRFVSVPFGNVDYTRWMNRATVVAGGARIATGAITMGCGHASTAPSVSAAAAAEHYDNTCSVVATARIGENRHGVWLAGALLPDVTPAAVARLLACQLSGDWRPNRDRPGTRELVGVLAVPVPGFPVAHRGMRVSTDGGQLVASAVPIRHRHIAPGLAVLQAGAGVTPAATPPNAGVTIAARLLAVSIRRDRASRAAALARLVRGG